MEIEVYQAVMDMGQIIHIMEHIIGYIQIKHHSLVAHKVMIYIRLVVVQKGIKH